MTAALRFFRLALHLAAGFACALAFPRLPRSAQAGLVRWWSRGLLRVLGVRLFCHGIAPRSPGLVVANHVSWLDIFAIAAVHPAAFVCKSEVAAWPGIGWLLARAGTVFLRRRAFRDIVRVNAELRSRLARGGSVAAFPEGTTTRGDGVLEFRRALFQPAVDLGADVHPVAIAYSGAEAAFVDEQPFLDSLGAVLRARRLEVHLACLEPVPAAWRDRRQLAARTRDAITSRLFGLQLGIDRRAAARRRAPLPRLSRA